MNKVSFFNLLPLLFQSMFIFSSDANTPTHTVNGVPVQIVFRKESEPDEEGFRRDRFVSAEGNDVEKALTVLDGMDLEGAELVTAEIDYQEGVLYVTTVFPNNAGAEVDAFSIK